MIGLTIYTVAITFSTFCLLKPHAIPFMDKILNQFWDERLTIGNCKMVQLDRDCASRLLMQEMGDVNPTLPDLVESITNGPALVLELFGQNAIRKLLDILGECEKLIADSSIY